MPIQKIMFLIEGVGWVAGRAKFPNNALLGIRLHGAGKTGILEVIFADIPGNSWNVNRLGKFVDRINQALEVRIPLTDPSLVDDEYGPNGTDPANPPYFYWDNGDLVSRTVEVFNPQYEPATDSLTWETRVIRG